MRQIYLDANAHVPMSAKTFEKYLNFNNSIAGHGHPSSPSVPGRAAQGALEEARAKIAKLIGAAQSEQIVFTNSCTQACEWVAQIAMRKANKLAVQKAKKSSVIMSPIEHPAMSQAVMSQAAFHNIDKINYSVNSDGVICDFDNNSHSIDVGICIHMQNEIGTIQPILNLPQTYIVSDMSQSLGKMEVNVTTLNVDAAVFGSHKFGGPNGVAFMYVKDITDWVEFGTGSRYYMDIPGTPNVSGIVASAVALEESLQTLKDRQEKMVAFRNCLEPGLQELGFEIIGLNVDRCPNTTFAKVPGDLNAGLQLMIKLGKKGIHTGLGSACGSIYTGGSPLMAKLGKPSDGQDYIRISQFGEYDHNDALYLLNAIKNEI